MRIAAVVLAAGASKRFGSPKQLARVGPRTMLGAVLRTAAKAGLSPVIAVVPPSVAVPPEVVPVINDAPHEGISRSLRLGVAAVPAECDGALILLGDQPMLTMTAVRAVLGAVRGDRPVMAAHADGHLGPPVLLMRDAFELAEAATGDAGLGPLLAARPDLVTPVEVGEHAADVDTPSDLTRIGHMFDSAAEDHDR